MADWIDVLTGPGSLQALLAFAGAVAGLTLLSRLGVHRVRKLAESTANDVDDLIAHLLDKTKFIFILLFSLWIGSLFLELSPARDGDLRRILLVVLLVQGGLWGTGVVNYLLARYRRRTLEEDPATATAMGAVSVVARIGVWIIVGLMVMAALNVEVAPLLTGLGIGGIAIALAVQNVLSDLFASLSIVLDKPFVVGDYIVVDDLQGSVEHVGLKTTRVRSLSGEQLVFSNSDLLSSRIRNYKRMEERRVAFSVGVEYGTPRALLEKIPDFIQAAIESEPDTIFDRAHFAAFGDSALEFEAVYMMAVPQYAAKMDTQEQINLELYRRFEQEGIEFAFPSQTVYLRREGAAVDPQAASGSTSSG